MVSNHLLVVRIESLNHYEYVQSVNNEVSTGVHEGPDVQVSRCLEAMLVVEDSLTITTDIKHCKYRSIDR